MRMIRRLTLTGLATCAVLVGGLASFGAPAFAFTFPEAEFTGIYIPFESFKLPAPTGVAEEPGHVSVEASSGDLFVTDPAAHKVLKLGPEGEVEGEITGVETPQGHFGLELGRGVAVDNSSSSSKGDVYIASYPEGVHEERAVVDKFAPKVGKPNEYEYVCELVGAGGGCHKEAEKEGFTPTSAFGGVGTLGVAVGETGDVYVTDWDGGAKQVYEFGPEGEDVAGSPLSVTMSTQIPLGIAVDAAGDIYAQGGREIGGLVVGEEVVEINAKEESSVLDKAQSTGVAVNPESGEVFVLDSEGGYHVTRYTSTGTEVEKFGAAELGKSSGIAYSSFNHDIYVTDYATGEVYIYKRGTPGPAPAVTACEAKEPKTTSVTLTCTVEPNASRAEWQFEYEQAGTTGFKKAPETRKEITSTGAVTETIVGLKPQTEYVYRLVALNEHGVTRFPATGTLPFETLPAVAGVTACAASPVAGESATLKGSLEPQGAKAEYRFQYGTSLSYGLETTVKESTSATALTEEEPVTGLEPNKTYDCRLAAGREIEGVKYTTYGENGTFTTRALAPAVAEGSESAPSVLSTSGVLSAAISPENSPTTYYFEYVEAKHYCETCADPYQGEGGGRAPAGVGAPVGEGLAYRTVERPIGGLKPNTAYRFRVVASNGVGVPTDGEGAEFTTAAVEEPVLPSGSGGGAPESYPPLSGPPTPQLLAIPAIAFPTGSQTNTGGTKTKKLTNALKACKKRPKKQRAGCVKKAEKQYGPAKKKKGKKG